MMARKTQRKHLNLTKKVKTKVIAKSELNAEFNANVAALIKRINKLKKDLNNNGIEMVILLASTSNSWTYQSASEIGHKFLENNSLIHVPSEFLHFCNDWDSDEPTKDNIALPTREGENQSMESASGTEKVAQHNGMGTDRNKTDKNTIGPTYTDECCLCDEDLTGFSEQSTDSQTMGKSVKLQEGNKHCYKLIDYLSQAQNIKTGDKVNVRLINSKETNNINSEDLIDKIVNFYNNLTSTESECVNNNHTCDICNVKLDKSLIKNHHETHKTILDGKTVACSKCDLILPEMYLFKHNCVKQNIPSKQNNTSTVYRDIRYDIAEIEIKHNLQELWQPIKCKHCEVILNSVSQCRDHLVGQHLLEYHCHLCDAVFEEYSQIKQHIEEHNLGEVGVDNLTSCADGNWVCSQCEKTFVRKSTLKRHIEQIHQQMSSRLHHCQLCKKKYRSEELMRKHQVYHKQKTTCDIGDCEDVFPSILFLKRHKLTHHKDYLIKNEQYSCRLCGQGFLYKNVLKAHLEWKHKLGQPQKCELCNKEFRGKKALSNHKTMHTQDMKYQCEVCGQSYKQRSGLFQHKKNCHNNETNPNTKLTLSCLVCLKKFKTQISFRHHLISKGHVSPSQMVSNVAILECHLCKKQFGIKNKLDKHVATVHMMKKEFKCDICDKRYSDKSNYRKHLNVHTGQVPKCTVCRKSFRSQVKLKQHNDEHHSESNVTSNSIQSIPHTSVKSHPTQNVQVGRGADLAAKHLHDYNFVTDHQGQPDLNGHNELHQYVHVDGDRLCQSDVEEESRIVVDIHFVEPQNMPPDTHDFQSHSQEDSIYMDSNEMSQSDSLKPQEQYVNQTTDYCTIGSQQYTVLTAAKYVPYGESTGTGTENLEIKAVPGSDFQIGEQQIWPN